jgi:hypothetical protein
MISGLTLLDSGPLEVQLMRARLPDESGYVVNSGVRIHYEVHGTGQPTILPLARSGVRRRIGAVASGISGRAVGRSASQQRTATPGSAPFVAAARRTLLAPGRYNGMDLPGEPCQMILMSGLPDATHLEDKFLATRLHLWSVLDERVRTRAVQGAGRCTGGPVDHGDKGPARIACLLRPSTRHADLAVLHGPATVNLSIL